MALEACPTIEEVKWVVFEMDGDSAQAQMASPVLSRILADRLAAILPKVISPQQTGFVKGRNITENYLLAQELLSGIRHKSRGGNVAVKLDMAKAYDRVSWTFTVSVLRKFGFGERFIDMVWRLLSNVWFSVIINGASYGFFKSSRGVRQGDPLSPALFVIGAEVLSRGLNSLALQSGFLGFTVPRGCPTVTHLAFADDVLEMYQRASGQLVNAQKSGYLVHPSVCLSRRRVIERITDVNPHILGRCVIPSQQESFLGVQSFCHLGGGSSLWVSFMRAKYCKGVHPCQVGWAQSASATWRRMLDVSRQMELSMLWLLTGGGCGFWYDNWGPFVTDSPIRQCGFGDENSGSKWEGDRPSGMDAYEVGAFTLASAYQEVRQGRTSSLVPSRIWQARILLKVSFFMLRLLMRRLPLDDVLGEIGFKLASKCFCCVDATGETLEHVFSTGQLALEVWSYFQSICGIASDSSSIRSHLFAWWMPLAPSGEQRVVCSVTRYLFVGTFGRLGVEWCSMVQGFGRRRYVVQIVRWEAGGYGCTTLNTDDCAKGNPGVSGGGGVLRDSSGHVLVAFSAYLGEGSSLRAETLAALLGIQLCLGKGVAPRVIQSDSLLLTEILQRRYHCPWYIRREVEQIWHLVGEARFVHCYREANKVADILSNVGISHSQQLVRVYDSELGLPVLARGRLG
nr:uncharacterized protein LOC113739143 [Coffea arabica]